MEREIVVFPNVTDDVEPPSKEKHIDQTLTDKVIKKSKTDFIKHYFPNVKRSQWNDWKWQLANTIKDQSLIKRIIGESNSTISNLILPMKITPYYASLIWNKGYDYPLSKTVIPSIKELDEHDEEKEDPLSEENNEKVKGLLHRYPDRVLLLVTNICATYCRYCTRSRVVGKDSTHNVNMKNIYKAIEYIRNTKEVRDVIISGGDPLILDNEVLEDILKRLRDIPHVEIIRIGTKVPVVLPQRITPTLIKILKKYHPLWMSVHFAHPDEITSEVEKATKRLADAGIPLGSQTVLLKGVNDNVLTMSTLMKKLLSIRVRPYYLYQCDLIKGSRHFRTNVNEGLEIIRGIRGFTSGYAVPTYVIDAPKGGGKIPLLPEYFVKEENGEITLKNYLNKYYTYINNVESKND